METNKSLFFRNVSGLNLITLLTSFITFIIVFSAVFGVGMGLGDGNINNTVSGVILILTFLIFSSPLFIVSYLVGRFSKNKKISAWSYALWAIIGVLPYPFILRNALSPDKNTLIVMGFVILVFSVITYIGVKLGYKKNK